MEQVEKYKREAVKIFQQITVMIKAAEADKKLQDFERRGIILALQESRKAIVDSILEMMLICVIQKEKECDTQQLSTSQK